MRSLRMRMQRAARVKQGCPQLLWISTSTAWHAGAGSRAAVQPAGTFCQSQSLDRKSLASYSIYDHIIADAGRVPGSCALVQLVCLQFAAEAVCKPHLSPGSQTCRRKYSGWLDIANCACGQHGCPSWPHLARPGTHRVSGYWTAMLVLPGGVKSCTASWSELGSNPSNQLFHTQTASGSLQVGTAVHLSTMLGTPSSPLEKGGQHCW